MMRVSLLDLRDDDRLRPLVDFRHQVGFLAELSFDVFDLPHIHFQIPACFARGFRGKFYHGFSFRWQQDKKIDQSKKPRPFGSSFILFERRNS